MNILKTQTTENELLLLLLLLLLSIDLHMLSYVLGKWISTLEITPGNRKVSLDARVIIIAGLCYSDHSHRMYTFETGNSFILPRGTEKNFVCFVFLLVDNFRSCLVQMSGSSPSVSLIFCFLVLFSPLSFRPFLCSLSYWNGFILGRQEVSFSCTASFNFGKNNPNQWPLHCSSNWARITPSPLPPPRQEEMSINSFLGQFEKLLKA